MKYFLSILFLFGCQTIDLKPDANPASIESDYLSVESTCNNKLNVGNNGCLVNGGLDSIDLKIRTIQSGLLTIHSESCGIKWSTIYSKSQYIKIPLHDLIQKKEASSCLLSVMISPRYEDQKKSKIVVHGFKGEILIQSIPKDMIPATLYGLSDDWNGIIPIQTRKTPHTRMEFHPGLAIDLRGSKIGFYNVIGCGVQDMGTYPDDDNNGTIFYKINYSNSCVYHGAIIPVDRKNDMVFSIMVNVFDTDYNRLQEPIIYEKSEDLILDFDHEVTFVELNDRTYNENQLIIPEYNQNKLYTVRAYTVKGRYIMGVHENGYWFWYN